MNFGNWQVKIETCFPLTTNRIYLFTKIDRGTMFLTHNGDCIIVPRGEIKPNEDVYFATADDEQIKALADGFAEFGVKSINDHKSEGLLEATRIHLEDMRKIVFKKEGIK